MTSSQPSNCENKFLSALDLTDWLALGIAFLFFNACAVFLYLKYYTFGYTDWDLAFYNQAMWNLSFHGNQFSSLFDRNLLGNHANLIAFLLIPLYRIFPHPLTLVFTKLFVFTIAAVVFYRYAKLKLCPVVAISMMLLYLIYPANLFSIIYEFDFESLSPVPLFLLYIFYQQKNFRAFLCTAILTILIKENLALIVCVFGLTGLFSKEKWKWGVIPLALGSIAFVLLTQVLIPYFSPTGKHLYAYLYSELGQTPTQIAWKLLSHPFLIFDRLATPFIRQCLLTMFIPLAFLPIFSASTLFYIFPILLLRILAKAPTQMSIYYYYGVSIAPFLFLAMVNTLSWIGSKPQQIFRTLFYPLLMLTMLCSIQEVHLNLNIMKSMIFIHDDRFKLARRDLVKTIPKDAPVIGSFDFLSRLSQRKNLYAFFKIYHYSFGPEMFSLPAPQSYAAIDFMDPWLLNYLQTRPRSTGKDIHHFFQNENWDVVKAYDDLVLFKKTGTPCRNCLLEFPTESLSQFDTSPIIIDDTIELHNFPNHTLEERPGLNPLPLTFFWSASKDVDKLYIMRIAIKQRGQIIAHQDHFIGYAIFPTVLWKKDNQIKENYWLWFSGLSKGEYTLEFMIFRQQRDALFEQIPVKVNSSSESRTIQRSLIIN